MEFQISVLEAKNLSQSALITRNLYSMFQVEGNAHRSQSVEASEVQLKASCTDVPLVITLKNGQTQTVMYVRNIPLNVLNARSQEVDFWVAMYAPGDPRNLTFDEAAAPRAEAPQLHLSFKRGDAVGIPRNGGEPSADQLRRTCEELEAELAQARQQAATLSVDQQQSSPPQAPSFDQGSRIEMRASAPSRLDHEALNILEKERQAADIKERVNAMADAQRQAQTTDQQLKDVTRSVEALRLSVAAAEDEILQQSLARAAAERDRDELRENMARMQETLRLRDLSIQELRSTRDAADRQLSEALSAREQQREDMDTSMRDFGEEVKRMASELDKWRQDACGLSEALQRCDREVLVLQEAGPNSTPTDGDTGFSELIRRHEEVSTELDAVRRSRDDHQVRTNEAEAQCRAAQELLANAETTAAEARRQLAGQECEMEDERQNAADLRAEVDAKEKQVVAQMGRAAQLEGQLSENKNQLREMNTRIAEFKTKLEDRSVVCGDLEKTMVVIRDQVTEAEREDGLARVEKVELEANLGQIRQEASTHLRRSIEIDASHNQSELEHTRHVEILASKQNMAEKDLDTHNDTLAHLKEERDKLANDVADVEAQAATRARDLAEAEAEVVIAERELANASSDSLSKEEEHEEAMRRLTELEAAIADAERQVSDADEEASRLHQVAMADDEDRAQREKGLEDRLASFHSELKEHHTELAKVGLQRESASGSLDEHRRLLPEQQAKLEQLNAAEQSCRSEKQRLQDSLEETRRDLTKQAESLKAIQSGLTERKSQLSVASASACTGESQEEELRNQFSSHQDRLGKKLEEMRGELGQAQGSRTKSVGELGRIHRQQSQLQDLRSELSKARTEASERLAVLQRDVEGLRGEGVSALRLRDLEAELARYESQGAELSLKGDSLDEQIARLVATQSEDSAVHSEIQSNLGVQRQQLREAWTALEDCDGELSALKARQSSEAAGLTAAQQRGAVLQLRVTEMQDQLAAAEIQAERATSIRQECNAALAAHKDRHEERVRSIAAKDAELDGTRRALERRNSDVIQEKNTEIDLRIERIDELEREVMALTAEAENAAKDRDALHDRIRVSEQEKGQTTALAAQQLEKLTLLKRESEALQGAKSSFESRVASLEEKVRSTEEIVRQWERDGGERVLQLQELSNQATRAGEEQREKVFALHNDVATQLETNVTAAGTVSHLGDEVETAKSHCSVAKRSLKEKQDQLAVFSGNLAQVQAERQSAEAGHRAALDEAGRQQSTLQELEEDMANAGGQLDQTAVQEQKVSLLKEQQASRDEAILKIQSESRDITVSKEDLGAELEQTQGQLKGLLDKLSYQVDHGNLQFSSIEQLEEEKRTLEGEAELLTLGLHEAEQRNEFLRKENYLMRQQVEGLYEGTLQDWAAEVHRVKVAAEVERHKDELGHWKSVAEDAERELRDDVDAIQKQQEEAESVQREKIDELTDELPNYEQQLASLEQQNQNQVLDKRDMEAAGSVHSVPAALHGLVAPAMPLPPNAQRRKALVIGCNYITSHAPLSGCTNDVWGVQCLLRHSLQYAEDQVRLLLDGSESCPSPPGRQPTRANIMGGLRWLTTDAMPGDNLFLFFCGYGTQQPLLNDGNLCEAHILPADFAEDLPANFFSEPAGPKAGGRAGSYRLVPLFEIACALAVLPASCKVTIVLDCAHSVVPGIAGTKAAPVAFPRIAVEATEHATRLRSQLRAADSAFAPRPRYLDLPPLPAPPSQSGPSAGSFPECSAVVHCFSACQNKQWCAELPIEGAVQGAFTWAFVKALTAGHLQTTVHQHSKALHSILTDLRRHFRWMDQTPVLQLSASAKLQDSVVVP